MLSVFHVAAFFIYRLGPMVAWNLEALCYYAQAWHLAIYHKALFKEELRAWRQGPVVSELFHKHRGRYVMTVMEVGPWEPMRLQAEPSVMEILNGVASYYGKINGVELRHPTHPDEPWNAANKAERPVLTREELRQFYEARTPPWRN